MRYFIGFITMLAVCFSMSLAVAHEKVIVVPLGGNATASSSGDSWIKVYDNNDVLVGYSLDRYFIISPNKYFTSINYNNTNKLYHYEPMGEFNVYYLSADCSGNPHGNTEFYVSTLPLRGAGQVATLSTSNTHFYIPLDATPIMMPVGTTVSSTNSFTKLCESSILTDSLELFEFLPNDPNVTGFPNTIAVPLRAVYTLPTTP